MGRHRPGGGKGSFFGEFLRNCALTLQRQRGSEQKTKTLQGAGDELDIE